MVRCTLCHTAMPCEIHISAHPVCGSSVHAQNLATVSHPAAFSQGSPRTCIMVLW